MSYFECFPKIRISIPAATANELETYRNAIFNGKGIENEEMCALRKEIESTFYMWNEDECGGNVIELAPVFESEEAHYHQMGHMNKLIKLIENLVKPHSFEVDLIVELGEDNDWFCNAENAHYSSVDGDTDSINSEFDQILCDASDCYEDDGSDDEDEDYDDEDDEDPVREKLQKNYEKGFYDEESDVYFISNNDKWGLADSKGVVRIEPCYDWMGEEVSYDRVMVGYNDRGCGFVDLKKFKEVVEPKYFSACAVFSEGFVHVQLEEDGKWGFIDLNGNQITGFEYDYVFEGFENGKAEVEIGGKTFYIDTKGNILNPDSTPQQGDTTVKKSAQIGEYKISVLKSGAIKIDPECDNVKGMLRKIAEQTGFEYDTNWTTRQFGSKLIDHING